MIHFVDESKCALCGAPNDPDFLSESCASKYAGRDDLCCSASCAEKWDELYKIEKKAWAALARYKFWMFGYWAACWVNLRRVYGSKANSPFRPLVEHARGVQCP